jgi:signal transduction histidine kinase
VALFSGFYKRAGNVVGFKRLFWRIFIAFWLGDLAIMFATGYTLIHNFESSQFSSRYKADIERQAGDVIQLYEGGASLKSTKEVERIVRDKNDNRGGRFQAMIIVDADQQQVFRYRLNPKDKEDLLSFSIESEKGESYQVLAQAPVIPRFFKQSLNRFQTYQFVIILISAAVVSALLSWTIVRPLKQLGAYSRSYASDQNIDALPDKLLHRGDELGDLAADIEFMVNQTDKTMNAQQQLLHDVSHELRAPLARLQASAALIEKKVPNSSYTDRIHSECNRIDQLIQQILNFSKLDKQREEKESFDLIGLSRALIDNIQFEYPQRLISLACDEHSLPIDGFPESLSQAIENIIRNACKYSPENSDIDFSIVKNDNKVIINIRDRGDGVSESELVKLQQPFYRAGNKMHTQGFGLGLSIAQRAIKKHNGKLKINNHSDGGLIVTIELPV